MALQNSACDQLPGVHPVLDVYFIMYNADYRLMKPPFMQRGADLRHKLAHRPAGPLGSGIRHVYW